MAEENLVLIVRAIGEPPWRLYPHAAEREWSTKMYDEWKREMAVEVVPASELEAAEADRADWKERAILTGAEYEPLRERAEQAEAERDRLQSLLDGKTAVAERVGEERDEARARLCEAVEALDNLHAGLTLTSIRKALEREFDACAAEVGDGEGPCTGCRSIAEFIALDGSEVRALARLAPATGGDEDG